MSLPPSLLMPNCDCAVQSSPLFRNCFSLSSLKRPPLDSTKREKSFFSLPLGKSPSSPLLLPQPPYHIRKIPPATEKRPSNRPPVYLTPAFIFLTRKSPFKPSFLGLTCTIELFRMWYKLQFLKMLLDHWRQNIHPVHRSNINISFWNSHPDYIFRDPMQHQKLSNCHVAELTWLLHIA